MFQTWMEMFLGKIGKYLINFIASYYYFIIPPVVLYGIFLTISSYNLKRIEKSVNRKIIEQARIIIARNKEINYVDLAGRINIDWERIIERRSLFPYISQESDLWVSRVSKENVREIIMQNDAKIRLVLERNRIFTSSSKQEIRKNLYTAFIHKVSRRKY
ncbi:MAG TPA: hypothetical protein DCP02_00800 [Actinobacteria bacterium]|nr:hypothetical protein [Actinomycetota bacterium]